MCYSILHWYSYIDDSTLFHLLLILIHSLEISHTDLIRLRQLYPGHIVTVSLAKIFIVILRDICDSRFGTTCLTTWVFTPDSDISKLH